jgi:excisionase family DNA binding protein
MKRQQEPGNDKGGGMQTAVRPVWVSYEEAQQLVGLGRTTLWRLAGAGEIKTAKVGRAVRINVESLFDYMERAAEDVANH